MSLESAGTQITTLSQELEFVNCYLEIEKLRFAEKLTVTLDISPETLDASVPHLLLQPLVDNAVKHGISRLSTGGDLRIGVKRRADQLDIEISDNGPGFSQKEAIPSTGLGLTITRERLESLYGPDHTLELLSLTGGGTMARICIPFRAQAGRSSELSSF
jgi:LytS/YehU family sensor histidine kinase